MADPKTFSGAIRVALREESLDESFAPQCMSAVESQNNQMMKVIGLLTKLLEKKDNAGNNGRHFRTVNRNEHLGNRNKSINSCPVCTFCEKPGHKEFKCWKKFPNLKPVLDISKNQGNWSLLLFGEVS